MATSKKDEEFRLLYQIFIEDIRFSKQQQWNTIYLTLVAIGATIALFLSAKQFLCHWVSQIIIIFISSFISWLGVIYLLNFQLDIAKYRYIKDQILKETFSSGAQELVKEPEWYKKIKGYPRDGLSAWNEFKRDLLCFFIPFSVVILSALVLITFIVKIS